MQLYLFGLVLTLCILQSASGMEPTLCVSDCSFLMDGQYQACTGCGHYAVCVDKQLYHKECVGGYVWDDSFKQCRQNSTTCHESCVKSCMGKKNGNYQSCKGCNMYVTCLHGNRYDNRRCAGNLVFNSLIGQCDFTSPSCP